jgi:hypothetical protein
MRELLNHLTQRGTEKNLEFSSCEILLDTLIGLDAVAGRMLIIRGTKTTRYDEVFINLDVLKSCSIKKVYGSIRAGELKKRKLEQLLNKISLCLEFRGDKESIEIVFYEYSKSDSSQRSALERKAAHWAATLSKRLKAAETETA